jgi:predicted DNA-binding protein
MSNLLNKTGKKKLLERGPQISPANTFKIDDVEPVVEELPKKPEKKKEVVPEKKATSVRVKKSTRDRLNALVSLNKADTIDELIEIMIDEYFSVHVTKDEKKQYDIVMELYKSKN